MLAAVVYWEAMLLLCGYSRPRLEAKCGAPRWRSGSARVVQALRAASLAVLIGAFAAAQNVVLITIDTLRADHLHCFGYNHPTSPELDRVAADGIRFEQAYTPIPVTLPSHTALLTGTLPPSNGVEDFNSTFIRRDLPTLAELLKRAGYATAAVVAAPVLDHRYGLNRGFDFYYDNFDFSRLNEISYDLLEHKADVVVDQALGWLRAHAGQKFFLWLHVYDPHYPYIPPPEFAARFAQPYDGEIAFADHELGRLFDYLRTSGLYSPAVIALSGDHGESLGEHGEAEHGFYIYDATLRVPIILKLPAQRDAGTVAAAPVETLDLYPTLLQLTRVVVPASAQGHSLLSSLHGGATVGQRRLFSETELPRLHFYWSDLRALRSGHYKYILAPRPELYDTSADPGERRNIIATHQALANQLRSELLDVDARLRPRAPARPPASGSEENAEVLRSLGYIAGPTSATGLAATGSLALPDPKDRLPVYRLVTEAAREAQNGRFAAALDNLNRASALDPKNPTVHYLIALYLLRGVRSVPALRSAAEHFRAALAVLPDDVPSLYGLALAYLHLGQSQAAIPGFERVLQLDPAHYHASFNLGVARLEKKDLAGAERAFAHAAELEPSSTAAWNALAQIYDYQGRRAEAQAARNHAAAAEKLGLARPGGTTHE